MPRSQKMHIAKKEFLPVELKPKWWGKQKMASVVVFFIYRWFKIFSDGLLISIQTFEKKRVALVKNYFHPIFISLGCQNNFSSPPFIPLLTLTPSFLSLAAMADGGLNDVAHSIPPSRFTTRVCLVHRAYLALIECPANHTCRAWDR